MVAEPTIIYGIYFNFRDDYNRDALTLLDDELFWLEEDAEKRCEKLNKPYIDKIVKEHEQKETESLKRKKAAIKKYYTRLQSHEESKVLVAAGLRTEVEPHPGEEPDSMLPVRTEPTINLAKSCTEYYAVEPIEIR